MKSPRHVPKLGVAAILVLSLLFTAGVLFFAAVYRKVEASHRALAEFEREGFITYGTKPSTATMVNFRLQEWTSAAREVREDLTNLFRTREERLKNIP